MATTNVYLTFKGNCEAAFTFYKKAFGGEFTYLGRFGEMPADENCSVSESDKNLIMHVSLPIGSTVLMGSDVGEPWSKSFVIGNNFSVSVSAESKEEADRLFGKLSLGGQITMPMGDTFWGDYFGMFVDQFGVQWMISFNEQGN